MGLETFFVFFVPSQYFLKRLLEICFFITRCCNIGARYHSLSYINSGAFNHFSSRQNLEREREKERERERQRDREREKQRVKAQVHVLNETPEKLHF